MVKQKHYLVLGASTRMATASIVVALVVAVGGYFSLRSTHAAGLVGDINGDGVVNVFDLSILLSKWGSTDASADLNQDGAVNIFDLSSLLSHWGQIGSPSPTPSPSVSTTPSPAPSPMGQSAGQWTMKFDDEFSGPVSTVDATNGLVKFGSGPTWKAWYPSAAVQGFAGGHANNGGTELEYYDISGLSSTGGILSLNATHDNVHSSLGFPYTSGMIEADPSFTREYGYAEARIKLPGVGGSWPAFWMLPAQYDLWPPEIDIMENTGNTDLYTMSNWGQGATVFSKGDFTDVRQWHVYGLKWGPGQLSWYLDGNLVATEGTPSSVPALNMYMVLDLAVNSTETPSFSMQVDYVRYWQ